MGRGGWDFKIQITRPETYFSGHLIQNGNMSKVGAPVVSGSLSQTQDSKTSHGSVQVKGTVQLLHTIWPTSNIFTATKQVWGTRKCDSLSAINVQQLSWTEPGQVTEQQLQKWTVRFAGSRVGGIPVPHLPGSTCLVNGEQGNHHLPDTDRLQLIYWPPSEGET